MKKLLFLIIILTLSNLGWAQKKKKLDYKIRTFGIGFYGSIGAGYPMGVRNFGSNDQIEPAYPIFNKLPSGFKDYMGNDIGENRQTYTLGATAQYKHSFGRNFLFTLMGGYAQTQISHYLINLDPFTSFAYSFEAWHEWYNYNQYFAGLQLGFPIGKRKGRFIALGCAAAIANINEPLFEENVRSYPGIVENNVRSWLDPIANEGFTFIDRVNSDVMLLTPSLKYIFQFGKYQHHAFELGFSYSFAISDDLVNTTYRRINNDEVTGSSELSFSGNHVGIEASYIIPIFRSKTTFKPKGIKSFKNRPSRNKPSTNIPPTDPILVQILPDMKNCFKTNNVNQVRYEEKHFKYHSGTSVVEFELYHKDDLDDGDLVAVCVDGKIQFSKLRLTAEGTKFKVYIRGKKEIDIIIQALSKGSQGNVSLGFSLVSGGPALTIEKSAKEKMYYLYKLVEK